MKGGRPEQGRVSMFQLDENLIHIGVDCLTKEDCIKLGANSFYENGYVKEDYINDVLEREKVYPTGLPGKSINIAIPHTNPTNVLKAGIGVIIPNDPVEFLAMGSEDEVVFCDIIMPLSIQDPNQQIDILKRIMKLLKNEEKMLAIKTSKIKIEVINILKEFFNEP